MPNTLYKKYKISYFFQFHEALLEHVQNMCNLLVEKLSREEMKSTDITMHHSFLIFIAKIELK